MFLIEAALLLTACSDTPEIKLKVVDVWGKPVAAASVIQEGVSGMQKTDSSGLLDLQVTSSGPVRLQAGTEGYIKDYITVEVPEQNESTQSATIELYPSPSEPGFYAVGDGGYMPVKPIPLKTVSTELSRYHGVQEIPKEGLHRRGSSHRFVYYAPLRDWEIRQLGLELAKLKFQESAEVTGVLGPTEIELNMWISDQDVEMDLSGLWAMDHYLITSENELEKGVYAFHAQSILNTREAEALEKLPKELQVVYPFEVN